MPELMKKRRISQEEKVIVKPSKGKIETFNFSRSELVKVSRFLRGLQNEETSVSSDEVFKHLHGMHGKAGTALRGARTKEGLTQQQLADRIGVKQSNIAAMESGNRTIGKDVAKRLAEVLNVNYRIFL